MAKRVRKSKKGKGRSTKRLSIKKEHVSPKKHKAESFRRRPPKPPKPPKP